ncbi:DNA cytosine methyltransferase [Ruminococcus sp.]|uniref:DNA cytosine methyltransferase n=1 Tax=Ruminococcus sp. TaxID=41978 RepID=UPI003993E9D2
MNILVACEESQRVTIEFRNLGHNAFSCDIINSSGGHPEWHINQDVIPLLNGNCSFITEDGKSHFISNKWDMIISFPPCTYLTFAGNQMLSEHLRTFHQISIRKNQRLLVAQFFLEFTKADCERIAIENPVGYMNSYYRKPDQIIHPYFFGDNALKRTCLWLKGLPILQPTKILPKPKPIYISPGGKQRYFVETVSNSKIRSKTFPGIANAMATQWSDFSSYYLL